MTIIRQYVCAWYVNIYSLNIVGLWGWYGIVWDEKSKRLVIAQIALYT